jgi:hypothetical protein
MTKNMSKEEYMKYTEARKASFTYKKAKKVPHTGAKCTHDTTRHDTTRHDTTRRTHSLGKHLQFRDWLGPSISALKLHDDVIEVRAHA